MFKLYIFLIFGVFALQVNAITYCKNDGDCAGEAICNFGLCSCPVGKVYNTDKTDCLEISLGIGASCEDTTQCAAWIAGSVICSADKKKCICDLGTKFENNECKTLKNIKQKCTSNNDCYDGVYENSLKCEDGKCTCNDGYYLRDDYDCRPATKNSECFFHSDCLSEDKCCEFIYGPLGKCVDKDKPNSCKLPKEENNAFKLYYDEKPEKQPKIDLKYTDQVCSSDQDCKTIDNSFCPEFKKKCTCIDDYIHDGSGACVPRLGLSCTADSDCNPKYPVCENNKCTCNKYFIPGKQYDRCWKPSRGLNMSCVTDENCYSLGLHGICLDHKCQCSKNSEYDEKYSVCKYDQTPCGDNCISKPNSVCQDSNCICTEKYTEVENKCLPNLGTSCDNNDDNCGIENAECKGICECKKGFLKNDTRSCIEETSSVEEPCISDIQCEQFLNAGAACINKTCTCLPNYEKMLILQNYTCVLKREIGDHCTLASHCKTMLNSNNVECRNNKCTCKYDHILVEDENGRRCTSDSTIIILPTVFLILTFSILRYF